MRLFKNFDDQGFMEDFIGGTTLGKMKALGKLCQMIGLEPGQDTAVRIGKPWVWGKKNRETTIEFEIDIKKLPAARRRKLKGFVELEVPSYAQGGTYESPPLVGTRKLFRPRADGGTEEITLDFQCVGAFVCKAVGKTVKPPTEWDKATAEKLDKMTPEEILAAHRKKIESLTAPREVDAYECAPASEEEVA